MPVFLAIVCPRLRLSFSCSELCACSVALCLTVLLFPFLRSYRCNHLCMCTLNSFHDIYAHRQSLNAGSWLHTVPAIHERCTDASVYTLIESGLRMTTTIQYSKHYSAATITAAGTGSSSPIIFVRRMYIAGAVLVVRLQDTARSMPRLLHCSFQTGASCSASSPICTHTCILLIICHDSPA
jgi:hypothetical protein